MAEIFDSLDMDKMEMLVGSELQKSISNFVTDLEAVIGQLQLQGVGENEIKNILYNDLSTGGRLFGKLKNGMKHSVSTAIGQASNEASRQVFENAGVKKFKWIAVSLKIGKQPCPDCKPRHGRVETMEVWRNIGIPKSGFSVCQRHCKCRVVPETYKGENLDKPLVRGEKVSITSPKMAGKHKTVKDAQKWAEKNIHANIDYGKTDIQMINVINKHLPQLNKTLDDYDVKHIIISRNSRSMGGTRKFKNNDVGEFDALTRTISLNERWYKSKKSWDTFRTTTGRGLMGQHPIEIIEHEIGHAIAFTKKGRKLFDKIYEVYFTLDHNIISKYAMTNSEELFAESYLAFRKYGKLPKELKFLEEFFINENL